MAREQDREADKARQSARFARQMGHWLGREEEQRRKQQAKVRRASQRRDQPRPERQWDEEAAGFEKMPRRGKEAPPHGDPSARAADLPRALVVAVHHGRVDLDVAASARIAGRLLLDPDFRLAVGDEVAFTTTDGPPRIEALLPRRTWLARSDPGNLHRDLVLAANVDVAVITVAVADPPLRPGLIDRFLLALARGGVAPVVCANKIDLVADAAAVQRVLAPYGELEVPVFLCSAAQQSGLAALRAHLAGKTCVFVGHSGVGKSSLLNALDPDGNRSVARCARTTARVATRPHGRVCGNSPTAHASSTRRASARSASSASTPSKCARASRTCGRPRAAVVSPTAATSTNPIARCGPPSRRVASAPRVTRRTCASCRAWNPTRRDSAGSAPHSTTKRNA